MSTNRKISAALKKVAIQKLNESSSSVEDFMNALAAGDSLFDRVEFNEEIVKQIPAGFFINKKFTYCKFNADIDSDRFKSCEFDHCEFEPIEGSGVNLQARAGINFCKFNKCTFNGVIILLDQNPEFKFCQFVDCDFFDTDFSDYTFTGTKFVGCSFEGVRTGFMNSVFQKDSKFVDCSAKEIEDDFFKDATFENGMTCEIKGLEPQIDAIKQKEGIESQRQYNPDVVKQAVQDFTKKDEEPINQEIGDLFSKANVEKIKDEFVEWYNKEGDPKHPTTKEDWDFVRGNGENDARYFTAESKEYPEKYIIFGTADDAENYAKNAFEDLVDDIGLGYDNGAVNWDNLGEFVSYLNDDALDFLYDQMIADRINVFQDMDDDEKIEELDKYGIDHGEEDLDEYAEDYAEAYVEKEGYTAKNAYDYWLDMFGSEQEVINMLKHNFGDFKDFLDITDVWDAVEAIDGIGNFIGQYDGREYDFKDLIIFRVE